MAEECLRIEIKSHDGELLDYHWIANTNPFSSSMDILEEKILALMDSDPEEPGEVISQDRPEFLIEPGGALHRANYTNAEWEPFPFETTVDPGILRMLDLDPPYIPDGAALPEPFHYWSDPEPIHDPHHPDGPYQQQEMGTSDYSAWDIEQPL